MINVSVVLPTYNRLERLQKVLAGLEAQSYPLDHFEVVVVSDGSSDGTDVYLQDIESPLNLKPVLQENQGPAAARNNGFNQASGEYILFIDDDVVPTPSLITKHLKVHDAQEDDVVVLGPMLTPEDFQMYPWVQYEQLMLMKQYEDMIAGAWEPTARQFYTGNTSLKRNYLIDSGGFDTSFRRAEDVELAYRLATMGLRFVFCPEAIGYHYAERSFASWLSTPYQYGRNDVIFARDKGQTWLIPTMMYEFQERNKLIQAMTRFCLDRKVISKLTNSALRMSASVGTKLKINKLTKIAYSGLFNLQHYQGVSDELGGRKKFFDGVKNVHSKPPVPGDADFQESLKTTTAQ